MLSTYIQMRTERQLEGRRQHNRIQPFLQDPQPFVFAVAEHHCFCDRLQAPHDEHLMTNLNAVRSAVADVNLFRKVSI